MLVKYKWDQPGCVAWFKKFMPWEVREVFDDDAMHLLGSHLFEIVEPEKKTNRVKARFAKPESGEEADPE